MIEGNENSSSPPKIKSKLQTEISMVDMKRSMPREKPDWNMVSNQAPFSYKRQNIRTNFPDTGKPNYKYDPFYTHVNSDKLNINFSH